MELLVDEADWMGDLNERMTGASARAAIMDVSAVEEHMSENAFGNFDGEVKDTERRSFLQVRGNRCRRGIGSGRGIRLCHG